MADHYPAQFDEWFQGVIDDANANTVVAVARGAIRFLQLRKQTTKAGITFISQHAVPFVDPDVLSERPVVVFDDSVIFGSTLSAVVESLRSRGVISRCASYVVDRETFLGESLPEHPKRTPSPHSSLPVQYYQKLWPDSIQRHHADLVQGVLGSTLHHNLDFPTIRLGIDGLNPDTFHDVVESLGRVPDLLPLHLISWPESTARGIFRGSAFIQHWGNVADNRSGLAVRPYSKVRFIIQPSESALFLTPIVQLSLSSSSDPSAIVFSNPALQAAWLRLHQPNAHAPSEFVRSVFRLATAFLSTIAAQSVVRNCRNALAPRYTVTKAEFLLEDMRFVLGSENADILKQLFAEGTIGGSPDMPEANQAPEVGNNPRLQAEITEFLTREPAYTPDSEDPPWESIGRVFLALRHVTDSSEKRSEDTSSERLGVGLNFEAIKSILAGGFGVDVEPAQVSLTVDMLVDRALAVPKITFENQSWCRTFYCGEDEEDQPTLELKLALNQAYRAYLSNRRRRSLTPFDAHKLCVVLRDIFPSLPLTNGPEKFGYVSTGEIGGRKSSAWMTNGKYAPFEEVLERGRRTIVPRKKFVSPVKLTWPPGLERDFFDGFEFLAQSFVEVPSEVKLVLSSCGNHRRAFNAFAFELHAWSGYEERSFFGVLSLTKNLSVPEPTERENIATMLYWSIQFITEARKKYRVFYRDYARLIKSADDAFAVQGKPALRWWKFAKSRLTLDPSRDPGLDARFQILTPLLSQMANLTTFLIAILREAGWCTEQDLRDAFAPQGLTLHRGDSDSGWAISADWVDAAKAFNELQSSGKLPGKSFFKQQLSEKPVKSRMELTNWTRSCLKECEGALDELRSALRTFCRRYDDTEYPFAPEGRSRRLEDGSTETRRDGMFILVLDIVKGTNQSQTNPMKDQIRAILTGLSNKGLSFEDTGNDAFIAVAADPAVLWDAACAIRLAGSTLIQEGQAFGGARKGLFYGSVAQIAKPSGEVLFRDTKIPNDIPQAFYILDGLNQLDGVNDLLIVECTCAVAAKQRLELNLETAKVTEVTAKHFSGQCFVIPLDCGMKHHQSALG